jgi:hypothetical protein
MTLTERVRPFVLLGGVDTLTGGGAGKLDGIATVSLPVPLNGFVVIGDDVYFYKLRAGTDAESSPSIIRPDDYAGGTNEKVWEQLDLAVTGASLPDADASTKGILQLTGDLGGTAASPEVNGAAKSFKFKNVVSVSHSTNQDDLAPTGHADAGIIRITNTNGIGLPINITGLAGGADGRFVVLQVVGSNPIVLKSETTSTAANRFGIQADLTLTPGNAAESSVLLMYDGNASRWRCFSPVGYLKLSGGTLSGGLGIGSGNLDVTNRILAGKWSNTISSLSYSATTDLDFDGISVRTLSLTGNVTFTTSNRVVGRMLKIYISCDGTGRTFTFPSWKWLQTAPTGIVASKKACLTLECVFGTADTDIVATYAEEP